MKHLHAVILAGGSGTRLWPLSTSTFPKQFLPMPNGNSMIQETLARVAPLISPERAWVVTGRSMAKLAHEHLPTIPVSHILGEPMGRSTTAAIGWAASTIARQDPDAIMASFHADAAISNVEALRQSLHLAYQLAEQGYLVTLGVKPTSPATGYGYIRFGDQVSEGYGHAAFEAQRFVEKPNLSTAESYLRDGHYVWNSGMFVWRVKTILDEIRTYEPEIAQKLALIAASMATSETSDTKRQHSILDEIWPTMPPITIDTGIMEKTRKLVVIPVDLGWNDVGNWEQYGELYPADEQGVRAVGKHQGLGSQNIFVYNATPRQIYTIGLEDVVVIEMEDMTVICHKNDVQRVKELAEQSKNKASESQ
jgi:mannose-1-phosphate guanylyltransferase/mannose-6-phosphate isomerase